jgi:hypothetical protein
MINLINTNGSLTKTSQWWILHRNDVKLILENDKDYRKIFTVSKKSDGAFDEFYFLSLLKWLNPTHNFMNKCSHTLYVPYGFGHRVHGFGTRLACFSFFSFRFEDVIADPRSPNHLHHETCRVSCRSLFCSTTLSNRNVFSSLSFVSSVLSKQH